MPSTDPRSPTTARRLRARREPLARRPAFTEPHEPLPPKPPATCDVPEPVQEASSGRAHMCRRSQSATTVQRRRRDGTSGCP
eukprot:1044165-Prymnesium_polylepis.1